MNAAGFELDDSSSNARNEYRYFIADWVYECRYENHTSLRAHLKLEFTVRTPAYPLRPIAMAALVDRFSGVGGVPITLDCVASKKRSRKKCSRFCVDMLSTGPATWNKNGTKPSFCRLPASQSGAGKR